MYLKIQKKIFKVKAKNTKEKQEFFFYSDIKGKESRKDDAQLLFISVFQQAKKIIQLPFVFILNQVESWLVLLFFLQNNKNKQKQKRFFFPKKIIID